MKTVEAQINLSNLKYNVELIGRSLPAHSRIYAVLKADAYGHNSVHCARALKHIAYGYAVARLEEAVELREAGIDKPILMLGGFFRSEDLQTIARYRIEVTVHSDWQIEALRNFHADNEIKVWLQVNIGMQRLGFNYEDIKPALAALNEISCVAKPVGAISHLSCADDISTQEYNRLQLAAWHRMTDDWDGELSLFNSAACAYFPEDATDYVRIGITQYGISPTLGKCGSDFGLKPVMTLSSELVAIRELHPGDAVGYGASWVCKKPTKLGIVAIGYADGYPRAVPNGTPVEINGRVVKTAGHVCMDMMFVDLGKDSNDRIGDRVYLWGTDLVKVETIAEAVNTIPYELVCHLSDRVRYTYTGDTED